MVGVNLRRYYYRGKTDDGVHVFHSEDWETVVTLDDEQVADVEQTRQDLENTSAPTRRQSRAVPSPSNENGTISATEPKSSIQWATPRASSSLRI